MRRRKFSREFKLDAVKLVRDRGATMAQAARDLDHHINVFANWVSDHGADLAGPLPGTARCYRNSWRSSGYAVRPRS